LKASVIKSLEPYFPLSVLLGVSKMARSTYYHNLSALSRRDKYAPVKERIGTLFREHRGRYGVRRITHALRSEGTVINHKTVERLMSGMGLRCLARRKRHRRFSRCPECAAAPNILARNFTTDGPLKAVVTDVTEFAVAGRKVYLSVIIDLFNREVLAFSKSLSNNSDLVQAGVRELGLMSRRFGSGMIFHSDQGVLNRTHAMAGFIREHGLVQSMSRRGNCHDNAVAESFFATMKSETVHLHKVASVAELEREITDYIEYYNNRRAQKRLGYRSPVQYRLDYEKKSRLCAE